LANCRLGTDLVIGDEAYDLGGAFAVCVGPLDWATYLQFVPGGVRFRQTRDLVRFCCRDPLECFVELTLEPGQIPPLELSSSETAGRLGLTSWVRTCEMGQTSVTFAGDDALPSDVDHPPVEQRDREPAMAWLDGAEPERLFGEDSWK
jgi:predicted component of type VI protein secretion system